MSAMAIETPPGLPLPAHREWTVADLEGLPDDGPRYELLDGLLLVTPAPVLAHQDVVGNLYLLLRAARPDTMSVLFAPVDWQPDLNTSLQPDLLVVRKTDRGIKNITAPLVLAVEVLSPSTRRKDLLLKRSKYQDCGVPSYWVIDPDAPSFTAYDLIDGHYRTTAEATGNQTIEVKTPFTAQISPAALVTQ